MTDSAFVYRPGLTHLRALSVVLVLAFHAGVIESGYLGVDVFFVLSGFLISNILWEALTSDRTVRSVLVGFYVRRCLRILPLSFLVLGVTAVAAHLFFDTLIDDWVDAGRAALLWFQNWFLIGQSNDYFASEGTNPFQHYWSLAVEEQFYVVLPLLMAGVLAALRSAGERTKLVALGLVSLVGIAAALASYVVLDLSVSEFYYSSFTRSYQLLAGVVAMVATRLFGLREDRRWMSVVGVAGLLLVGGVLSLSVVVSGLLATGFALLCMLSSQSVLLDHPWVERLGLWSYGIYLWHFPINEYLLNERLGTPALTAFGTTLLAATGLAAFTYRFFETPIRTAKAPAGLTFATTGLTVVVAWLALGLLATPAPPEVFAAGSDRGGDRDALEVAVDGTVDLAPIAATGRLAAGDVRRVEGWMALQGTSIASCGSQDIEGSCVDLPGEPRVLLLGDSFANSAYQALRPLAEEEGWGLATFVRPGCPWVDDVFNDVGNDISERCADSKQLQRDVLAALQPDVIVIHSYPYRDANRNLARASTGEVLTMDEVAAAADETLDGFVDAGARVVFIEPTPFADDGANADECLKIASWADDCDFTAVEVDSELNRAVRERAEVDPRVWFTSINDVICDGSTCGAALGELALMADSSHVSGGVWVRLRDVVRRPLVEAIAAG